MKGDPQLVGLLDDLLAVEPTAVHRYVLHARTCEDWAGGRGCVVTRRPLRARRST